MVERLLSMQEVPAIYTRILELVFLYPTLESMSRLATQVCARLQSDRENIKSFSWLLFSHSLVFPLFILTDWGMPCVSISTPTGGHGI